MSSVEAATIRKILDSRGNATVEVELRSGAVRGKYQAASGASTGTHEALAFPKAGVDEAVRVFRKDVAPRLLGRDVADQAGLDRVLRDVDGTANFARVGGNAAVAASIANARLGAALAGQPLFRFLGGPRGKGMPFPFGNVIGGGRHAIGGTVIQEYLVVSQGPRAEGNVFANARVHRLIREALQQRFPHEPLGRGDEGAWVAKLDDEEALSLLSDTCKRVEKEVGFPVRPGLDLAASEYYSDGTYHYRKESLTPAKQLEFLERIVKDYGIYSLEDPLEQEDFEGFAALTEAIGKRCVLIGDDIFVTNRERLKRGIEEGSGNAILIKPNQIGTLTETQATVEMAHKAGYASVVSHRSGETPDDAIAHLAVAFGSLGIKTGTVGGERIAKLNELIRIQDQIQGDV